MASRSRKGPYDGQAVRSVRPSPRGETIGAALGWFYWIYVGVKLGSFAMVIFALLGPLAFIASILGLWSFIFGVPLWLVHLVRYFTAAASGSVGQRNQNENDSGVGSGSRRMAEST